MSIRRPKSGLRMSRIASHPGTILRADFLEPLNMSANRLALELRVPATRIGDIIHERRAVSAETALRLARYFGTTAEFWLNLQKNYELTVARQNNQKQIEKEVLPRSSAA